MKENNEVNDLLRDSEEKHDCGVAFDSSVSGVLVAKRGDGNLGAHPYGLSTGELSYAIALLQRLLFKTLDNENKEEGHD